MIKDLFQRESKIRQHKSWQIMRMDIWTQTSLTGKNFSHRTSCKDIWPDFHRLKMYIHMDNTLNSSEPFLVINLVRESSFQANGGITAWECITKNTLTVPCFCISALLMHIWQLHCSVTIHEDTVNKEPQNITIADTS